MLAANPATSSSWSDFETDPRLIAMFHGPILPGRPVSPVQGVSPRLAETVADNDFPEGSEDSAGDGPVAAPSFPLDQTFKLHSRPDSDFTIYLDFDGHVTVGTSWNSGYGISEIVHPNYWGGTGSDFSDSRLELIQDIWRVVAEDFAPFDVNVTTEEPGDLDDLRFSGGADTRWGTRVVMTKDTFANCGCGGHAYLGSFDDRQDEPSLVYNGGLNTGSETVSHEVGHQLGLNHDGVGSTTYYRGHGSGDTGWGPIMGAPFSKRTTHWSNGDYFNASNTSQDDLAVITRGVNFPYAPDDHADELEFATPLIESGITEVEAFGIIEQNSDVDWFRFRTGAGDFSFSIDVLDYKPNLDVWAGLYDSSGSFIADANPQSALSASFDNISLPAGEYFIKIDGVSRDGTYDPALDRVVEPSPAPYTVSGPQGYSDYGSLGQYRIHGSIIDQGLATVSINATNESVVEGDSAEFTLTTSDGSDANVTVQIVSTRQTEPGMPSPDSAEPEDFSISTTQVVSIVDGTATLTIPVIDDSLIEATESFAVTIVDPGSFAVAERRAGAEILESKTSYSIFADDAVTVEGDVADEVTHTFTVRRNGRDNVAHRIGWRRVGSGNDPADVTDFTTAADGIVDFAAGETSHQLEIGIVGDLQPEPDERYSIELFVPDGNSFELDANRKTAEGRIDDDESVISLASSAQFRLRQVRFSEGNRDNWAFDSFRITGTEIDDDFDPAPDGANWAGIENGSASDVFPGSDGNALFFNGGAPRAATTIPVSPPPGAKVEFSIIFADENGNGVNATENGEDAALEYSLDGDTWTRIELFDEAEYTAWTDIRIDLPPDATFNTPAFDEGDVGTNTQSIGISRTGYLDKPITVDWVIAPGDTDPVSADDFVGGLPQGTASFSAGESTVFVEIPVQSETAIEPDESFIMTVTSNSGGPIVNGSLAGTILNDDFVLPEIDVVGANDQIISDGDLLPSSEDGTRFVLADVDGEIVAQSFEIRNRGVLDLDINSIEVFGAHASDFTVSQFADSVIAPGQGSAFELTFDPSAAGRREATVVIRNNDPNESEYTFAVEGQGTDLRVVDVIVNGGEDSRSQLNSVDVVFNQLVSHQMLYEAFSIRNLSADQSVRFISVSSRDVDGQTVASLTFAAQGSAVVILEDGNYELHIHASQVMTPGVDPYAMRHDYWFGTDGQSVRAADQFFRFFGDSDGDRDVDGQDYGRFGMAFLQLDDSQDFDERFDVDLDGDVDGQDYGEFGERFLKTLAVS